MYYAMNIISTKVKLFSIRCGINQAVLQLPNIDQIVVVMDVILKSSLIRTLITRCYELKTLEWVKKKNLI